MSNEEVSPINKDFADQWKSKEVPEEKDIAKKARDHANEVARFYSPTIEAYRLRSKNSFQEGYTQALVNEKQVPEDIELTICEYINDRKTDFTFDKLVELGKYCYGLSKKGVPDITVKELTEDEIYEGVYMEVVELVEKDNIQCGAYSDTVIKLYEKFVITKRPPNPSTTV